MKLQEDGAPILPFIQIPIAPPRETEALPNPQQASMCQKPGDCIVIRIYIGETRPEVYSCAQFPLYHSVI